MILLHDVVCAYTNNICDQNTACYLDYDQTVTNIHLNRVLEQPTQTFNLRHWNNEYDRITRVSFLVIEIIVANLFFHNCCVTFTKDSYNNTII